MFRSCRFLLFVHHNYRVSLNECYIFHPMCKNSQHKILGSGHDLWMGVANGGGRKISVHGLRGRGQNLKCAIRWGGGQNLSACNF